MDQIKKFIAFLDKVPEGKEMSLRQQITLILWGMVIVVEPFTSFPFGIFRHLSTYPLLAIIILNLDKWVGLYRDNKYLRYTLWAIAGFIAWPIVTLPFSIGLKDIPFSRTFLPTLNYIIIFGAWYFFLATCFLLPGRKVLKTFYWSLTITLSYLAAYSAIEYMHFCGEPWATEFLSEAIHWFIFDVGEHHGWWPPVFWDTPRLRSVFAEPSYFSGILTFSMVYYGCCAWIEKKWFKISLDVLMMVLTALLLCGTRSASGTLTATAATALFIIVLPLFFRKLLLSQKIKGIILAMAFIVLSGCIFFNQRGGIDDWQLLSDRLTDTLQEEPRDVPDAPETSNSQTSPAQKTARPEQPAQPAPTPEQKPSTTSSSTRFIHLQTELELISQYPVFGCGQGRYEIVLKEGLRKNPEKTGEIRLWSEQKDHFPPRLNKYTSLALEYGIPGLILFLLIFFPAFICAVKTIKHTKGELWVTSLVLFCPVAFTCCTICNNLFSCICFLVVPCYFFISKANAAAEKSAEKIETE